MRDKTTTSDRPSPADIAREVFRLLAARRIAPTPEAYRDVYNEVAGIREHLSAEKVLADFAAVLTGSPGSPGGIDEIAQRFSDALRDRDWESCSGILRQLAERPAARESQAPFPLAVIEPLPDSTATPVETGILSRAEVGQVRILRDLLVRTLTLGVSALLQRAPELAAESEAVAESIRAARTEPALEEVAPRLKNLCFQIEMKSGDLAEEHELLLRLFRLLLENVGELVDDDSWLKGQVASVQNFLSGPLDHAALISASRSLKEVIYRQGMLKQSLKEAKASAKEMMITFIDRLAAVASSTGNYHTKIDKYSRQISDARDIGDLNKILGQVMLDTRIAQTEILRTHDDMLAARQEVQQAEGRIHDLEGKLRQMSELVREDGLTGSLNRRGLDDVFEREMARSQRSGSPLCVAMLDLDDFKRLNDAHGHAAGDKALIHLVEVVKDTLRTMDVIARFGGEEFLILLPDTRLDYATHTITRLQRELTKRLFMHNNERLLITFSAGVALRKTDEDPAELIKRADTALYQAKRTGKNRVVAAE